MIAAEKQTFKSHRSLVDHYLRARSKWYRLQRLLFPSPAEIRFVELMGGRYVTFKKIRGGPNHFPLVLILSLGRELRAEHYRREVRVGKYFVDFGNDVGAAIEIDGRQYHMDVVADIEREMYLYARSWRLLRVQAPRLWNDPKRVQRDVLKFITK